jgi:hypothetical protein
MSGSAQAPWGRFAWPIVLFGVLAAPGLAGNDPNLCDQAGEEPDVIVGELQGVDRWGKVSDITGFSFGTISCNVGTCWLNWIAETPDHPVIGQSMYRLRDGRFEQIGQSWLKHGFAALSGSVCSNECIGDPSQNHLGVNCSDPYSSFLNGLQSDLGPKFEVDPAKGIFPMPFTGEGQSGNAIFKRLQLHDADLDPALNAGALYFAEGQYITADDAGGGNGNNNASHREVSISGSGGVFDFDLIGPTFREEPAINAWAANEVGVVRVSVDVPDDGRFHVAGKATDLGAGMWHYEYAVHNMNSNRAGGSFSVPIPAGASVTNLGFHDVEYHSGEPFDGTAWSVDVGSTSITWETESVLVNPDANALRWGTLYNFRFDADVPPATGNVTLGLFLGGTPPTVDATEMVVPRVCDTDGNCEPGEECGCADCPGDGADADGDGAGECVDCDDGDPDNWAVPGEVLDLIASKDLSGTTWSWDPPLESGTTEPLGYEIIRARYPDDFVVVATCLDVLPGQTSLTEGHDPVSGSMFAYLVRAVSPCGVGSLGVDSGDNQRAGRSCL